MAGVAGEVKESTGRWLIGVLLGVGAIVATLVAADKIPFPGSGKESPPPSVVDGTPRLVFEPASAKPGTTVNVRVSGFGREEVVTVRFTAEIRLASLTTDGQGKAEASVPVPSTAATGSTTVTAQGTQSGKTATALFQVLG